jgi:hypothetical protein
LWNIVVGQGWVSKPHIAKRYLTEEITPAIVSQG